MKAKRKPKAAPSEKKAKKPARAKKTLQTFEVGIPVRECWIYRVHAVDEAQAIILAESGIGEQICTVAGSTLTVRKIEDGDI